MRCARRGSSLRVQTTRILFSLWASHGHQACKRVTAKGCLGFLSPLAYVFVESVATVGKCKTLHCPGGRIHACMLACGRSQACAHGAYVASHDHVAEAASTLAKQLFAVDPASSSGGCIPSHAVLVGQGPPHVNTPVRSLMQLTPLPTAPARNPPPRSALAAGAARAP